MGNELLARSLGDMDYRLCWSAMKHFTAQRSSDSSDELWLLEHPSVYTLGQRGQRQHLHDIGREPVVQSDRGGLVTWHGPGQLIAYLLIDLKRLGCSVHALVDLLQVAMISFLDRFGVVATTHRGAPGVYVDGQKIGALGLRIRHGCSYHGLSLNISNSLEPFAKIDPCGDSMLTVTSLARLLRQSDRPQLPDMDTAQHCIAEVLADKLSYQSLHWSPTTDEWQKQLQA